MTTSWPTYEGNAGMTSVNRRPDRRSPLVLDVLELSRAPGMMREIQRTVPAPADLGIEVIGVPTGSDIDLDLRAEDVGDGILISGTATAQLRGECVRCLAELDERTPFKMQELFFNEDQEVEEGESQIQDDMIDLDEALRHAVVLELPFKPLCGDDCAGLCSECGADLNEDPTHAHAPRVDSRWEKLAELDLGPEN